VGLKDRRSNFADDPDAVRAWCRLADHARSGLSIREAENPVTGNASRFLPHAIPQTPAADAEGLAHHCLIPAAEPR
jgi:hypothetical protein